jgi:hypothetical protein
VDAQDRTDPVVLEPGGEDVGRAVAQSIGDEDHRPLILLPNPVIVLSLVEAVAL